MRVWPGFTQNMSRSTAQYIEKLDCPTQQKLQLIDAIAQTILERCEGKAQR